ncbi:MAG: flavin reductase family protein [Deltaproteobacteria bacterium]|nr:flavin reductase family protein [Deltaproteobacteria bacterium]
MEPKLVDAEAFKAAMRTWASGVTILTSVADGQIHGMTVSAFSSVSAQPPLVLVCANQASFTHEVIEVSQVFGVNVLAAGQEEISNRFAMGDAAHRFEGVPWTAGSTGTPLLDGALCNLECRVRNSYREGTHTIYIGEVMDSRVREDAAPLVYFDGGYRSIG